VKPFLILAVLATTGCGTTTQIITEPPGATAIMNDSKLLGTTPITVEAQIFMWTQHAVRLEKDGFESAEIVLRSVQPISTKYLALCLCSFTMLWPLGLLSDFESPLYRVVLTPTKSASSKTQLEELPNLIFSAR